MNHSFSTSAGGPVGRCGINRPACSARGPTGLVDDLRARVRMRIVPEDSPQAIISAPNASRRRRAREDS